MDEVRLRQLLDWPEDRPEPPSMVSLTQALLAGRRRLRWRRLGGAGSSVLAACAAVAIAIPVLGSGHEGTHRQPQGGSELSSAPRFLTPLVPYATFGWLPGGSRLSDVLERRTLEYAVARSTRGVVSLEVMNPGQCTVGSAVRYHFVTRRGGRQGIRVAPHSLDCMAVPRGPLVRIPLVGTAVPVDGGQAWWMFGWVRDGTGVLPRLAWQYAPGGWAIAGISAERVQNNGGLPPAIRSELHKLAEHVRFGAAAC